MSKKNERYNTDDDLVKSIKKGVSKVCRDYDVVAAYLYGSYARSEQHQDSDVDIGIYFEDYSLKKLLEMSRKIQGEVDLSKQFDVRALNDLSPSFQFRVIQEGKILYESSPEERADVEVEIDRRYHDIKPHLEEHWTERRKRLIEDG